ncbi:hypothetical protein Pelo_14378 [Pelomyxa schiedti]|nr:hypothetical protein Pelo_14378 [Pelomyxa schiedti]
MGAGYVVGIALVVVFATILNVERVGGSVVVGITPPTRNQTSDPLASWVMTVDTDTGHWNTLCVLPHYSAIPYSGVVDTIREVYVAILMSNFLVQVDLNTGEFLGKIDVDPAINYFVGLAFDSATGNLYATAQRSDGYYICQVDLKTGLCNNLVSLGKMTICSGETTAWNQVLRQYTIVCWPDSYNNYYYTIDIASAKVVSKKMMTWGTVEGMYTDCNAYDKTNRELGMLTDTLYWNNFQTGYLETLCDFGTGEDPEQGGFALNTNGTVMFLSSEIVVNYMASYYFSSVIVSTCQKLVNLAPLPAAIYYLSFWY